MTEINQETSLKSPAVATQLPKKFFEQGRIGYSYESGAKLCANGVNGGMFPMEITYGPLKGLRLELTVKRPETPSEESYLELPGGVRPDEVVRGCLVFEPGMESVFCAAALIGCVDSAVSFAFEVTLVEGSERARLSRFELSSSVLWDPKRLWEAVKEWKKK